MAKWGRKARAQKSEDETASVSSGIKNTLDTKLVAEDKGSGAVGRSFGKINRKLANHQRLRVALIVVGVAVLAFFVLGYVGVISTPWTRGRAGEITSLEYEKNLSRANTEITAGNFEEARKILSQLEDSKYSENDYAFYAAQADLEGYTKNYDKAKESAKRSLQLMQTNQKSLEQAPDGTVATDIFLRMTNYTEGGFMPHSTELNKDYTVPKEVTDDPQFQG